MSVIAALEALPTEGLTVKALEALDFVVPGEWTNHTRFDDVLTDVTGISNPVVLQQIRVRAMALEANTGATYDEALRVYALVDSVDQLAAGAAVASKVSSMFGGLGGLLDSVTPKPETTQCVDAGIKLVAELAAFGLLNGMPTTDPDGLARFTGALADYGRSDLMRVSAWVVYDGLLPLGPNFLPKMIGTFKDAANNDVLTNNPVFKTLGAKLPGAGPADKQAFIVQTLDTTSDWISRFVADRGLTHDKVMGQLQGVLSMAGGSGDYVAAAIDAATSYTAHTGTQTVARSLARNAYREMQDNVWDQWVTTMGGTGA